MNGQPCDAAPLVLSIVSYDWLRDDLCRRGGLDAGAVERQTFPDGERYLRLETNVEGRDVVLVGGTASDADAMELFDLACAAVGWGAARLTLVIPYFGYATTERATGPGEVVTAKTRARLLSAIPAAPMNNRALLLDLHSEGIPYYFGNNLTATHVYGKTLIGPAIRRLGGSDFVLASTDAGRAKWVQSLANDLGVPAAFIIKRRLSGSQTEVASTSADVAGKTVILYDDMIRTGSSLVSAARAYRAAGAASVSAVATHGVFPGDSLQRIRAAGAIEHIVTTDSHPRARGLAGDYLEVLPVAELFAPLLPSDQPVG